MGIRKQQGLGAELQGGRDGGIRGADGAPAGVIDDEIAQEIA